jgi:hypothetical protein
MIEPTSTERMPKLSYSATLSDCPGNSAPRDLRKRCARIYVNGMASDGSNHWETRGSNSLPKVLRRPETIGEVVFI